MTTKTQSQSLFRRTLAAVAAAGVIGLGGVGLMPDTASAAGVTTRQAAYATVPAPVQSVTTPANGSGSDD